MDSFSSIKKESDQEGESAEVSDASQSNVRTMDSENLLDMSQTIQQILANSVSTCSAGLLSPSQILQASASAAISLPWLLPHYQQMLILQQRQQQFLVPNATEVEDGQLVVVPQADEGQDGQQETSIMADSNPLISALLQRQVIAQLQQQQQQLQQQQQQNLVSGGREVGNLVNLLGMQVAQADENARAQQVGKQATPPAEPTTQRPKPPKKPLTPYMLFSKEHWHHVKAANSHLSTVTEIGAIIGSMWRELDAEQKLKYNERFTKDKIRYDEEIRAYLQNNNLSPSDLIRTRLNRKRPLSHHQQSQQLHSSATTTSSVLLHSSAPSKPSSPITAVAQQPTELQQHLNVATGLAGSWSNRSIQQILASMGFTNQAIYSQGDGGTINTLQDAVEPALQQQDVWKSEANEASPEGNENDQTIQSSMPPPSPNAQSSGAEAKVWTWHHHHHRRPDDDSHESDLPVALTKTQKSDRVDSSHENDPRPVPADEPEESQKNHVGTAGRGSNASLEKLLHEREEEIAKLRKKLEKADQEIERLRRSRPIQSTVSSSHPPDHPVSSSSRCNDSDGSPSRHPEATVAGSEA